MLLNQNAKDQLGKLVLSVQLESTSIEVDYFDIKAVLKSAGGGGRFHYVVLGRPVEIDSMDMGNLIDNLLRNGIEACEEMPGGGQLEIIIRKENGVVEIEVENTIKESVIRKNPKLKSSKKEKGRHGFGMESIWKIIEQYQGEYICREEVEDRVLWFEQSICLKIQKERETASVCMAEIK